MERNCTSDKVLCKVSQSLNSLSGDYPRRATVCFRLRRVARAISIHNVDVPTSLNAYSITRGEQVVDID